MGKTLRKMRSAVVAKVKKQQQEQQALVNASAITDSGRTTAVVDSTANTTAAPATATATDDLSMYINDMRNRRKKGAPLVQSQGALGQQQILGV